VRLLLVEASLLSLAGGALGLWIAYGASRLLASTVLAVMPTLAVDFNPAPDARVLAATLGFCALATLVFGLGPALRVSRADVVTAIKDGVGTLAPAREFGRRVLRHGLVVSQIALSLALLSAGGLFLFGALRAGSANPGFSLDRGVIATIDSSLAGYDEARARQAFGRVLERLRSMPGVESASIAHTAPYGERNFDRDVLPAEAEPGARAVNAQYRVVGADYFRTLGMAVVRGREFSPAEEADPSPRRPVVVDTEFAARTWPGEDPIGRRIRWAESAGRASADTCEVVGVVNSLRVKLFDRAPRAHVYEPFGGNFHPAMMVHVRTAPGGPAAESAMLRDVGAAIRAVDADLPVLALRTLRQHRDAGMEVWFVSLAARVFAVFGLVALVMAGVGLYGVRAFVIGRRTREFGIRMAIGATAGDVLRLVMTEGGRLVAAGLGIGLLLSAAVSRLLAGWVYGVGAFEPAVFGATSLVLTAVMLLACYVPARRAIALEPTRALRHD
jgi:predicted permease